MKSEELTKDILIAMIEKGHFNDGSNFSIQDRTKEICTAYESIYKTVINASVSGFKNLD